MGLCEFQKLGANFFLAVQPVQRSQAVWSVRLFFAGHIQLHGHIEGLHAVLLDREFLWLGIGIAAALAALASLQLQGAGCPLEQPLAEARPVLAAHREDGGEFGGLLLLDFGVAVFRLRPVPPLRMCVRAWLAWLGVYA